MYFFVIDRRSVNDSLYTYWDRLLPELQSSNVLNEKREIESDQEAINLITKLIRQKRYQTVVVVGDDAFLATMAGAVKGSNLVLGYIPFGDHCNFGQLAGLSCRVGEVGSRLASRKFVHYDLVQIGSNYMVNALHAGMLEYCDKIRLKPRSPSLKQHLTLRNYKKHFTARVETREYSLEIEAVNFSIFNHYPFLPKPAACESIDPSDGVCNIHVMGMMNVAGKVKALRDICRTDLAQISHLRVVQSRVSIPGEVKYLMDGRYVKLGDTFDVEIHPKAFRMIQ